MDSTPPPTAADIVPSQLSPVENNHQEGTSAPAPAQRKKRKTITKEMIKIIMYLHDQEPILSTLQIARVMDLSHSCVKNVVKKLREDDLVELPDFGIVKKGRKVKATPEMAQMD